MTTSWLEQDKPTFDFQALQSDERLCGTVVKDPFVSRLSVHQLPSLSDSSTTGLAAPRFRAVVILFKFLRGRRVRLEDYGVP